MKVLIDTNIALRLAQPNSPQYPVALRALSKLRRRGDNLFICLQTMAEFWAVATRPVANNGFGRTIAQADVGLRRLETQFTFLEDPPTTRDVWRRLVRDRGVAGKPTHDARLAATAITAGVPAVLTFNVGDFARFAADGLVALDPAAV